ncbi:MAG: hypothetical protein QG632_81 [Candidatus Dependentiae bacterium]|nr:hypothetical protein [Candidatus Dependentiae bacterium]
MAERIASTTLSDHERGLIDTVTGLPHKILRYHSLDGLSQMVLHELGHDTGFGFDRATYLIDNPDFDHLLGVAGFDRQECSMHKKNIWEHPEGFCKDMESAAFNKNVRKILNSSVARKEVNLNDAHDVKALGFELGIKNPQFFAWDMKHGNHGVFIYEKNDSICLWRHGLLKNMSSLLGMCGLH